jgi:putative membrane protein
MSDIYEVEAGKIANEKGKSEQVKQFGQQMVETHTKTTEELEGIVEPEKIKVDLPTKVDDKHQGMIDALNRRRPTISTRPVLISSKAPTKRPWPCSKPTQRAGDNAAVKAIAAKTLPVIKEHLEMAKKLEGQTS